MFERKVIHNYTVMGLKTNITSTLLILFVISVTNCITISSNGNSQGRKIVTIDKKDIEFGGFVPIHSDRRQTFNKKQPLFTKTNKIQNTVNSTVLPVNERYRRLIPYMTFYLANDFNDPQNDLSAKTQFQKIAIPVDVLSQTHNNKVSVQYSKVPQFQGNRLTQFNIASANPDKIIPDFYYNQQQSPAKIYNSNIPINSVKSVMRPPPKQTYNYDFQKPIPVPVKIDTNAYNIEDISSSQYFIKSIPKQQYKLIPYEQTPPVHVPELNEADPIVPKKYTFFREKGPVSTSLLNFPSYDEKLNSQKYEEHFPEYSSVPQNEQLIQTGREFNAKENFINVIPTTSTGFKPMLNSQTSFITPSTKSAYKSVTFTPISSDYTTAKPNLYYKTYTTKQPVLYVKSFNDYPSKSTNINYGPSSSDQFEQNNLAGILKSLQDSNSLPQTITADNVDSSIKALVKILKNLKQTHDYIETSSIRPVMSTPVPFQPAVKTTTATAIKEIFSNHRPSYKAANLSKLRVHIHPSQNIDSESTIEPPSGFKKYPSEDDELGGTPGRPGIDYPTLATIPTTNFNCKTQRYKGFFGDPETNCQVWHYCDLNGGQASFLCPNGTIFSQVALTCDWWFNVKCSTTTQLYVLNERLYKYILPFSPKFPEDYSGPLVDKYLAIKYKEMEEKMKKKKKVSKPETIETEKIDVIEIKTSGMSGALKPYA